MCVRISTSAPTKLDLLSLNTFFGIPLLLQNRENAMRKDSVDNECDISGCTARIFKQVKRQPYLFSQTIPRLT